MSTVWTPTGSGEQPWPDEKPTEKQDASTAFPTSTPEIPEWIADLPEEKRQYALAQFHIALDTLENNKQLGQENQYLRQALATVAEATGADVEAILAGEKPRMVSYELYQRERQRAYAREKYTEQLYGNQALNSTQKIGLDLLLKQVERGKHRDPEGRTRINARTIARTMGMSESTGDRLVSWCKKQLPHFFDITSHDEPAPDGSDELIPRTYVKVIDDELARTPQLIAPLEVKKPGGDQYTCPFCGTKHGRVRTKTTRTFICKHCQHEVKIDEKVTEQDLPYTEEDRLEEQKQFAYGRIAHAGYRAAGTLELIDQALDSDHTLIVLDIRLVPESKNAAWTKAAFTERWGKRYTWLRDLGNINYKERGNVKLASPERGLASLHEILQEHSVILLCGCENYDSCHRRSVIEQYAQKQFAFNESFCLQLVSNLQDIIKPVTPPDAVADNQCLQAAAELLLEIAGDAEKHIVMPPMHPSKYLEVKRRLELDDVLEHLRGGEARGALCRRTDGRARGYCWDTDTEDGWELVRECARRLVAAGFQIILEESPAGRGGHLWILFEELVQAELVRAEVYRIAPDLATLIEYWPNLTSQNRVRLPGGYYARYGSKVDEEVRAWCKLVSVADGESSQDGLEAAALLLAHQNPVDLIPKDAAATIVPVAKVTPAPARAAIPAPVETTLTAQEWFEQRPLPEVDEVWMKNNGPVEKTTYYFAITEGVSAAWFNEQNPLDSIRPRERNGKALSPNGDERTGSAAYWQKNGEERYTDFSTHGLRADGTRDTGDGLEYASKVWGESKAQILARNTGEMIKLAKRQMEEAARAGGLPPMWVMLRMTPAGWRRYDQLTRERTKALSQEGVRSTEESPKREEVRPSAAPVPAKPLDQVDVIKTWGKAHGWPAFEIDGQRVIAAGQSNWLSVLMLAGHREEQARVYAEIQRLEASPEPAAPQVSPALDNPVVLFAAELFNAKVEIVAPDQGQR